MENDNFKEANYIVRQIKSYIEEVYCEFECGWTLQGFISSGGTVNSGMRASVVLPGS